MKNYQDEYGMLTPKVAAMFQAVLDLIMEDADLGTLKVVDITKKAGIGKGTAYEYFDSKEELIAAALIYYMKKWLQNMQETMRLQDSFLKSVEYLFDIFCKYSQGKEQNAFARISFLMMTPGPSEIKEAVHKQIHEKEGDEPFDSSPFQEEWYALRDMVEDAIQKGELRPGIPSEFIIQSLVGRIMQYLTYYMHTTPKGLEKCSLDRMRELLVQGFVREFANAEKPVG